MNEQAFAFTSKQNQLAGIVHGCVSDKPKSKISVLIIVGGPQTRVGSHRQFVLLSRYLAKQDIPSMRFDYAGMGDSEGESTDFMQVSDDIEAAIAECLSRTQTEKVVLWGLCDAASAALIYAIKKDCANIPGMVLLNPWVRSEQGQATAMVKHYYLQRFTSKAFWKKVLRFEFNMFHSLSGLLGNLTKMRTKSAAADEQVKADIATNENNYIEHMLLGLTKFNGQVLLITSGQDLTAAEFLDLTKANQSWKTAVAAKISEHHHIEDANHTFSTAEDRGKVEQLTANWIDSIAQPNR